MADSVGFTLLSDEGVVSEFLPCLADSQNIRFNDAKCDPRGRAWAGSIAYDSTPGAGTLFRLDAGPVATPVLSGLTVSNGLDWSPGGSMMWFADSAHPWIGGYLFDLETGAMGPLASIIELQQTNGIPDGLCVDNDGCLWVALWGGGAVHRYTPDGRLDAVVRMPVPNVTSCAFGGYGASTLFITTARYDMTAEALAKFPQAGGLFAIETGSSGRSATHWMRPSTS